MVRQVVEPSSRREERFTSDRGGGWREHVVRRETARIRLGDKTRHRFDTIHRFFTTSMQPTPADRAGVEHREVKKLN
jgi:hypothetical protein